MRELLMHATIEELYTLMDLTLESETTTDNQAEFMYSIVDELMKRGEIPKATEKEKSAFFNETMRRAKEQDEVVPITKPVAPSWADTLMKDIKKEKMRIEDRRKAFRNVTATVACVVITFLLTNVIALAAGFDFLGTLSHWTKDALYVITGREPPDVPVKADDTENDVLESKLAELNIEVDLPTYIPEGFIFDKFELISAVDLAAAAAWFSKGNDYFSIKIRQYGSSDEGSFSEADGEEYTETYPGPGGKYLIASNLSRIKALWYQDDYEIQIQGNLTYEQLTQMLDSIGK